MKYFELATDKFKIELENYNANPGHQFDE